MSTSGSIQTDGGKVEEYGLSLLDVVKHALNTVVENLDEGDNLSIVTFNSELNNEKNFASMT